MLPALVGTVAVVWIAVALARPRKPVGLDDTPWFVYSRYCGARDRLILLAILVTAGAFLTGILSISHAARTEENARVISCTDITSGQPQRCYMLNAQHGWDIVQQQGPAGSQWRLIGTLPPTHRNP